MREPVIHLRRAQEAPSSKDGYRVLVDRLWPRGRSHAQLKLDEWCKSLAPSDSLRRWFGHDPERWKEFQRRYRTELKEQADELDRLLEQGGRTITLVYAARDQEHNQAVVLRKRLLERFRKRHAR